jgi:hypothetical protein
MAAGAVALNPLTAAGMIVFLPVCVIMSFALPAPDIESGTVQRSADQSSADVVARVSFSSVIEAEALDYARKTGLDLTVHVDGAAEPPDSLLEIAVPSVFVITDGSTPLYLVPRIEATVRVLRQLDQTVLDSFRIGLYGEPRLAEDMLRDEGLLLREALRRLTAEVTERALDEVLLVRRPAPEANGEGEAYRVPDFALRPLQPPLNVRFHLRNREYLMLDPVPVADLRPEFAWEPRPRADTGLPEIGVTYDLRVFEQPQGFDLKFGPASTGSLWDLLNPLLTINPAGVEELPQFFPNGVPPVYERFGLVEPRHRLEVALEPCRKYRWTVRARWAAGSAAQATEWMGAWNVVGGIIDPRWQRRGLDFVGLASVEDSPLLFYAPFLTPSADGRKCPAG